MVTIEHKMLDLRKNSSNNIDARFTERYKYNIIQE